MFDGCDLQLCLICLEDEVLLCLLYVYVMLVDLWLWFFVSCCCFEHVELVCCMQIDYDCEMSLVVIDLMFGVDGLLGEVCVICEFDGECVEFVFLVCYDWQGWGFGWLLMDCLLCYLCVCGVVWVCGECLVENDLMCLLVEDLGFECCWQFDDLIVKLCLQFDVNVQNQCFLV